MKSNMKVTILGTGTSQGVPVITCTCDTCTSQDLKDKRLRCSVLVEIDGTHIVIDTGPDFRQQMLSVNANKINAALITHEHNDHVIGLDDIRPFCFIQKQAIDVFAMPRVAKDIRNKFAYAFINRYPSAPRINLVEIMDNKPFKVNDIEIIPVPVMHGKLDILGYRIKDFVYITDASFVNESSLQLLKNVDTLIINALRNEEHPSHFNLREALNFILKVAPRKAFLTHISHHFRPQQEWCDQLPENVKIAHDGLCLFPLIR